MDPQVRISIDILRCASEYEHLWYVSTPVTTGARFVDWRRGPGRRLREHSVEYQRQARARVMEPNIAHVKPLVRNLRAALDNMLVIDPSALADQPGWRQGRYHAYWLGFIRKGVDAIVMADGWNYSVGCALEYVEAVTKGLPVFDEGVSELQYDTARVLVDDAVRDLSRDSVLPVDGLLRARAALDALCGAPSETATA